MQVRILAFTTSWALIGRRPFDFSSTPVANREAAAARNYMQ
jgi:hypothetical protein